MATLAQWIDGARPRTLPNAIAPVIAGVGAAYHVDNSPDWLHILGAFVVAIALIVGVNYANDYSDGVRGTDDDRVGPQRLVGSGAASPKAVRTAAFVSFAVAGVVGVWLALATHWWLIPVGAVCILAAWFYTGGRRPYGYAGFGELAVFVFFGLVAVCGTQLVAGGRIDGIGLAAAVAIGSFSAAVLVTNNLRDLDADAAVGKRTLAVRLGDYSTRYLYAFLITVPFVATLIMSIHHQWALFGLLAAPLANGVGRAVVGGAKGPALIKILGQTGLIMLAWAVLTAGAFIFGLDGLPHTDFI
ncbi:1,4-dihydroxy-2-naphthoate octaprenyltransferase [Gordonia araii NBRC 100433]|uniref:1,4-dihydroxy-2-naphthoate octaprenyltransferase n=1 Tax=Gordonia araii NBRC 100433 TaxID=1073574 RepID=G7H7C3_9ACTN|nr:1,4-dihydroxy-2-naphthoate polyprenyltransferase [Gordonia araii]NNG98431.1 1,4-dihydroxy-2-naphthoate polyprenyltransferase [Gordonia araii NBRC 100433]GAB11748.1 1,4-dihydroxy-2-naphthoate octaprenyltransferase [Gordonia araii NBRC 100433]